MTLIINYLTNLFRKEPVHVTIEPVKEEKKTVDDYLFPYAMKADHTCVFCGPNQRFRTLISGELIACRQCGAKHIPFIRRAA